MSKRRGGFLGALVFSRVNGGDFRVSQHVHKAFGSRLPEGGQVSIRCQRTADRSAFRMADEENRARVSRRARRKRANDKAKKVQPFHRTFLHT